MVWGRRTGNVIMAGLVDQWGRRLAVGPQALYKTPSQNGENFRPWAQPRAKTYEAVTSWQRREMVDVSRVLAAGVPNINNALKQAGMYSVSDSWHIKSKSANRGWGRKRDEWFNEVYSRDCNARGPQYDWRSSLMAINWSRKVEADYGIVFDGAERKDSSGKTIPASGQFSVIKFDRISTGMIGGWQGVQIVSVGNGLENCYELPRTWNYFSGASGWSSWPGLYIINDQSSIFDGQRIIDGVIVDANMRTLGYRIVGFNSGGLPVYCDVPKAQIHFNFSARQSTDYLRGIPELAENIIPLMHLDDIQNLMEMAIKLASTLAIGRESVDGNPMAGGRATLDEPGPPFTIQGEPADPPNFPYGEPYQARGGPIAVQQFYPGLLELSVQGKEKLVALGFDRPTMNEEAFIKRVEKSVLHTLWPRDLIYADDSGRAGTRAIAAQANTICVWDQMCLERDARWIADRATEFAMRNGEIPMNNNLADPYDYGFTVPAKFTVDEGNDSKMRLLSLGRCTISRGMISELEGYMAEEIEEQREAEIERQCAMAERIVKKHAWLTEKEVFLAIDSGGQNISFADNAAQDADQKGAGAEPGTDEEPESDRQRKGDDKQNDGGRTL